MVLQRRREYELLDTGIMDDDKYFDVVVEFDPELCAKKV